MGNNTSCCLSKSHGINVSNDNNNANNDRRHNGTNDTIIYTTAAGDLTNGSHDHLSETPTILKALNSEDVTLYVPDQSSGNLQHISEREPNDDLEDPSISPSSNTIFLSKFKYNPAALRQMRNRRKSEYFMTQRHNSQSRNLTRKYSSCSTIFIDESTVSLPNLKYIINAVSLAIYYSIKNRDKTISLNSLDIFDEKLHPLSKDPVSDDYSSTDPDHKIIYRFIRMLFNSAQLTAECAIVSLVYLERLLTYTDLHILPANWKRVTLASILLSSKVWDDQAVWNVDYCQIMKDISVDDMNELERQFLEMLQFNINVTSSVYTKYYFDLRTLAHLSNVIISMELLYIDKAVKIELLNIDDFSRLVVEVGTKIAIFTCYIQATYANRYKDIHMSLSA